MRINETISIIYLVLGLKENRGFLRPRPGLLSLGCSLPFMARSPSMPIHFVFKSSAALSTMALASSKSFAELLVSFYDHNNEGTKLYEHDIIQKSTNQTKSMKIKWTNYTIYVVTYNHQEKSRFLIVGQILKHRQKINK